jgi:hypothetical protein
MRLKLFSCHHVAPEFTCNTEIFQTLVSNVPAPADGTFMSDLDGINIGWDNLYSELRHQYFVWKNLLGDYDYVGFEHYRRPFFIDTLPAERVATAFPEVWNMRQFFVAFSRLGLRRSPADFEQYLAMRRSLDETDIARLKDWIGAYDVVVPRPNVHNIQTQWKSCFDDDVYWDLIVEGVNRSGRFFETDRGCVLFEMEICHFANMYIMRSDLLNEYLTFCFDVLAFYRPRLPSPLLKRALGYVSERLFSFWLFQKQIEDPTLRVLHLPLLIFTPALELTQQRHAARPGD